MAETEATEAALEVVGRSDIGRLRQRNEDSLGDGAPEDEARLASHGRLFAVADGMGGHALGEVASRLAIDTLFAAYYGAEAGAAALRAAVVAANTAVWEHGRRRSVTMGTTLTALALRGEQLLVAHVGDSRAYRLRHGRLERLTEDHSLAAEELRLGRLTPAQARYSAAQHVLTRCIGCRPSVEVDLHEGDCAPGDLYLLCSDGLHGQVDDDELALVLAGEPLAAIAERLVVLANERGGPDNISCLLLRQAK